MKWGHDQLQNDLAAHLSSVSDRMVWTNMQLGPSGSPRPDVYTAPKSYSKFLPIAYEIKISVADFRSDVTSGKWQSYLQYACGVIFAVPSGLITKDDLPKGCGLMVRGEEGWRTAKAPTLSPLTEFPRAAMIKLLIDGIDRAKHSPPNSRTVDAWKVDKAVRKQFGAEVALALSDRNCAERELRRQEAAFKKHIESAKLNYEAEREARRQQYAKEEAQVSDMRASLCEAIGLRADASTWEIRSAIARVSSTLIKDAEIERMRAALKRASNSLKMSISALDYDPLKELADQTEKA